jgi:hypothetical protein
VRNLTSGDLDIAGAAPIGAVRSSRVTPPELRSAAVARALDAYVRHRLAECILCAQQGADRSLLARVGLVHGRALGAEAPVPILARIHWRLGRVPASRLYRRARQQQGHQAKIE